MRILGINLYSIQPQRRNIENNQYDYSRSQLLTAQNDTFVKSVPDISFTAIRSAGDFRSLVNQRKIHCIYCGRPLLSNKIAARLKANGVFSGPIKNFAQEMFNYIEYLHPSEKEALKKITLMAFDYPNIRLSEAIKKLYPKANEELLKEQKPIFKELSVLANQMPHGWKTKYQKLLKITRNRLEEKEYIPEEFSGKEFAYKIYRISDTVKDEYMASRIIKLTEPLTHPIFKNPKEPLTEKFIDKILRLTEIRDTNKNEVTKSDLQLFLIGQIRKYAEILNRKDIINFCDIGIATIEKKPVKIKFSNKAFRYDLNEALEGMPDDALREKISSIVKRLPDSRTSVNAFITKHELAASDAIGYDLLRPSIVTIEHMHPKSQNGANELWNYALSCERDNNNRSDSYMKDFINAFPKENQQRYFNEIFEEVFKGNIPKETAQRMLKVFFNESGRQFESPKLKSKPKKNYY